MKEIYSHIFSIADLRVFRSMACQVIANELKTLAAKIEKAQTIEQERQAVEDVAARSSYLWMVHEELSDLLNSCALTGTPIAMATTDKDVHDFFFSVAYAPECDAHAPKMLELAKKHAGPSDLYQKSVSRIRHVVDHASVTYVTSDIPQQESTGMAVRGPAELQ